MRRILSYSLFFLMHTATIAANSAPPMELTADSSDIDFKSGVSVFRGNVHIKRTPAELFADQATVYTDKKRNLEHAVLIGSQKNPARFTTEFGVKHEKIIAVAKKIIYLPLKDKIRLEGQAKVTHARDNFSASVIEINPKTKHIRTFSKGKQRTRITVSSTSMRINT